MVLTVTGIAGMFLALLLRVLAELVHPASYMLDRTFTSATLGAVLVALAGWVMWV